MLGYNVGMLVIFKGKLQMVLAIDPELQYVDFIVEDGRISTQGIVYQLGSAASLFKLISDSTT